MFFMLTIKCDSLDYLVIICVRMGLVTIKNNFKKWDHNYDLSHR